MIICYSGTGNTLHIAEKISENIVTPLFRIGFDPIPTCADDILGICLPVYFCTIPASAEKALEELEIPGDPYIFLIATCGGMSGNIAGSVSKLLKKKGKKLHAAFDLLMPDTYIKLYDIPSEGEIAKTLSDADTALENIMPFIRDRKCGIKMKHAGIFRHLATAVVGSFYKSLGRDTSGFTVSDACISCKKCVNNCPSGSIFHDGRPVWVDKYCDGCLCCVHICPTQALQYGKQTSKRGRYIHPEMKTR